MNLERPKSLCWWAGGIFIILLGVLLCGLIGTLLYYAWVCGPLIQATLNPLPATVQQLQGTVEGANQTVAIAKEKVQKLDLSPVNQALRNVRDTTGNVQQITADVNGAMPRIHKGLFYLWKHADRTLGHFDEASKEEVKQQKAITEATVETLKTTNTTVESYGTLAVKLQPVASHADTALVNVDGITEHGNHIAEHYDNLITAPKRWWQKLTGWLGIGAKAAVNAGMP